MILDSILSKTAEPTPAPEPARIDHGGVHFILKNDRRRRVVDHLRGGPVEQRELIDRMTVEEFGPEYDAGDRKCIVVGLTQSHLPQMQDLGVVDVRNGDGFQTVHPGVDHDVARYVLDHVEALFR